MKGKVKKYIRKRALFGLTILLFFIVLSIISLMMVRKKILDNIQLMGEEVSEHLLIKENGKIENYDMFVRTASIWLDDQIKKNRTEKELREWMKN